MLSKRHEKLGIKQTVQPVWMDKTVQMMLAGLSEQQIRTELDEYLSTQKQSGGIGARGEKTYRIAIALLASWFSPADELAGFRNNALNLAGKLPASNWLPLHWAVISASYPFWFNVAKQAGRLLNLQNSITQAQIFNRLKEHYGDRETVARNARYAVRSFVAWGVLKDTEVKGCYQPCERVKITEPNLTILLYESALHAEGEGQAVLGLLKNNPAFFPFQLPVLTGDYLSQRSNTIDVVRYGLDDELLKLRDAPR